MTPSCPSCPSFCRGRVNEIGLREFDHLVNESHQSGMMVRIGGIIPKWPIFFQNWSVGLLLKPWRCVSLKPVKGDRLLFFDEIASIAITSVAKLKSAARCPTCQTYRTYRRLAEDGVRSNEQRMVLRPLATSKSLEPLGRAGLRLQVTIDTSPKWIDPKSMGDLQDPKMEVR